MEHLKNTVFAASALTLLTSIVVACSGGPTVGTKDAEPDTEYRGIPESQSFTESARAAARVLAASGGDTVWSWPGKEGAATLVWTSENVGERWRSSRGYAYPVEVELIDTNADSLTDLFWTIDHGDVVGGTMLHAMDDGATIAYGNCSGNCSAPELWRTVHGDSLTDVVRYAPSPFGSKSCFRVDYSSCKEEYPTSWATLFIQTPQGFVEDSAQSLNFYSQMAYRYSQASVRLQNVRKLVSMDSAYFKYEDAPCTMDMRWSMDSMAVKAYMISHPDADLELGAR